MPERSDVPIVLPVLLWCAIAPALIAIAVVAGVTLSTDSAMRLAEVRDLLAGQSWFDTVQHRMNAPFGLPMHWSRLIDAGIAGLILCFRLFMNPAAAEAWAIYVWPLLPLLPVLLAVARIGARLAGRTGGLIALALTGTCFAAASPFQPGVIDHHNVQLALMLWFVVGLMEFGRARWAAPVAALCACLSLAVGLETLPYIVVGAGMVLVLWIVEGGALAAPMRRFAIVLVAASAALLFGAVGDAYRFSAVCDTFSGLYGALGIAGGIGLAAMTMPYPAATSLRRAITVGALAAALFAIVVAFGPDCLRGPYAQMDPRIGPIWLANIVEAKSPFFFAEHAPAYFVSGYVYALFATIASVFAALLAARDKRAPAIFVALFALTAVLTTTWQVRGLVFALLFAMPGLAACVVAGVARLHLPTRAAAIACALAFLAASDAGLPAIASSWAARSPGAQDYTRNLMAFQNACLSPAAMAPLRALPPGRVLALVNEGPAIIAYTKHSAVAGPYHRNASGILDTYDVFTGTPDTAERIVRVRGIDYVAVCPPEQDFVRYLAVGGANSLLTQLANGGTVPWLTPLPSSAGAMKIWRVIRGAGR